MEFKDGQENGGEEAGIKINDENERSKIGAMRMRAIVEREDPSAKEVDDLMMRRFLVARDLDIEKASKMFVKYLSWRRTFVPNGHISESEISTQLPHNKFLIQGFGKQGQPVLVYISTRHKPGGKGSLEELKRYLVYVLDKVCERMPRGNEKFLAIVDLEGWGYSHCDIRGHLALLSVLQDCYPERLDKLYILHAPYIFMTAWKAIYPFIDNRTRMKVAFVDKKKVKSTLLDAIDDSQLPDMFGGKLPHVPVQDC